MWIGPRKAAPVAYQTRATDLHEGHHEAVRSWGPPFVAQFERTTQRRQKTKPAKMTQDDTK